MSKNNGGRPSAFDPKFLPIVARMRRNKLPVRMIAKVLGVSERTTWRWRQKYKSFNKTIKATNKRINASSVRDAFLN